MSQDEKTSPGRIAREAVIPEFRSDRKGYPAPRPIEGVKVLPLRRFVDDRGFFMEIYRNRANQVGTEEMARFFDGVEVAQLNFSVVDVENHIKGLHYHLGQEDLWFCPPPSKMKVVLFDVRVDSPTSGATQVVVLGDGKDAILRIPAGVAHGYRPLTHPCSLFYIVTKTFDLSDPDEYRIAWDHPAIRELWDVPNV
jgi:dTDP-4-dehydrorhamnose 3,5-epimerase